MKKKITIAIDGFSSTGKSTIAKEIAKSLGYVYVDTGAMYRAVTLFAMNSGMVSPELTNSLGLIKLLPQVKLQFKFNEEKGAADMYLNDINVEDKIRTLEVSNLVSVVAAIPEVRYKLVEQQREMGKEKGIVMDGRDIGTVVFPDAELKLFMTASAEVRAERRYKELTEKGEAVDFDAVLSNIQQRDHIDSTREDSPLVKAEDAVEIDNSYMSREEQFARILSLVHITLEK
ncbi:cytidylate kinase [Pustulibacterium marinum]|uniref:Cytidylate kinase n=1 Tax=Pustulibacterium marinum TaxID=1224947 RepID=A0A1I7FU35_9FLAO|nr:(d)CMP kinase [Pustulibacterium marinum]SFU39681.1 cytidylate kinase [Pustulibacterium marinum]